VRQQLAGQAAARSAPSKDAFFEALPADELTPSELALRQALVAFVEGWPRLRARLGKPAASCPLLADLGQDAQVQRCRSFLPHTVLLREWIDRRVGGELDLRKDAKGQLEMHLREATAANGGRGPSPKSSAAGQNARDREDAGQTRAGPAEAAEEFFGNLPTDRHSDAEADLRQALLAHLESAPEAVPLSEVTAGAVARCQAALLPAEVPLRMWIDHRIGGEVETLKDGAGRLVLQLRDRKADAEPGRDREALKEQFFSSLPADGFTPDEEQLREALLDILRGWKAAELPTLSFAGGDARVRKCRAKVLTKGAPVTLRDWIDRRIGGEVELSDAPSGQLQFGLRGQGSRPQRKRGAAGGERERGPSWKKGAGGGPPGDWR